MTDDDRILLRLANDSITNPVERGDVISMICYQIAAREKAEESLFNIEKLLMLRKKNNEE